MPGQVHGPRNLGGYRPWGHKELDTSVLYFLISLRKKDLVDEERKAFKFKKAAVMNSVSFPGGANGKKKTNSQHRRYKRHQFHPWGQKIPWRRAQQPTPVFLPGESHGQKSQAGYSLWGHKELDMTEATQYNT